MSCAATGCEKKVPPDMLMCGRHWFMVPESLRRRIWKAYRNSSADYTPAVNEAIASVAAQEGKGSANPQLELG